MNRGSHVSLRSFLPRKQITGIGLGLILASVLFYLDEAEIISVLKIGAVGLLIFMMSTRKKRHYINH